jgi:hypothetical protein
MKMQLKKQLKMQMQLKVMHLKQTLKHKTS